MPALKSAGEGIRTRRRMMGRHVLVAGQIALSMVLLIVAGLFLDGFRGIFETRPGFRTDHLIGMDLDPSVFRRAPEQTYDFYRKLLDRVRAVPGVESAGMAEVLPYAPNQSLVTVVPEGYRFPKGREKVTVFGEAVDGNYFSTMDVAIVRGRGFSPGDRGGSSRPVAVVNQEFAATYWPNSDPMGRRFRLDRPDGPAIEVVGVAKTGSYLFPAEPPRPYVYLPYDQNRRPHMTVIAESYGDPAALAAPMRDAVRGLDADLPVLNLRTMAAHLKRVRSNYLVFVQTYTAMALVGLILAMTGLYGLISYSVSRRIPEIGVRMAIGASRADVARLVLRQGLILAGAGIAIGGVLAAFAAPALASGFLGRGTRHVATWIVIPLGLLLASVTACYLPARRASSLDPIRALRHD